MEEVTSPTTISTIKLNTLHLKTSTLEILAEEAVFNEDCFASQRDFPYLKVYAVGNLEFIIEIDKDDFKDHAQNEIPEDLRNLIEVALELGCTLMFLEEKGDVYSGLPKFYD